MKFVRFLLIGIAVLGLLALVAITIAFTSGFQTWAARKALASQPNLRGTVGSLSAGLKHVEVKDLRIEQDGAVLTLPSLQADLPLWPAGVNKQINVSRLVAKGWVLDLSHLKPAAAKPKTAGTARPRPVEFSVFASAWAAAPDTPPAIGPLFQGIFAQLQLPVDLALDGVELEGEIVLPAMPNRPTPRVKTTLRGGGLAAGQEGKFAFDFTGAAAAGVAPVSALALHGTLTATMDTPHSFTRLTVKSEASASGTQFPAGVKLSTDIVAAREATGENYGLTLAGDGRQLAVVNGQFPHPGGAGAIPKLTGTWKLDLRDADLTPFLFGIDLPKFEASGEGGFETDAAFAEIHTRGKLNATAEKLGVLQPELAAIGTVRLVATFDLAQAGEVIRVEHFAAEFSGDRPVASVNALQAFECNWRTVELKIADPTKELLGVALHGVPMAWAQPFVKGLTLAGGDLTGEFAVSARGGLALRSKAPLAIAGLAVAQVGKPLFQALDISIVPSGDYTPQGWQIALSPVTVKSGASTLATLEAKAGQLIGKGQPIRATGLLAVNLPAVLAQPAAAGLAQLTAGDATIDFAATIGAKQEIQARLAVTKLATDPKTAAEKLPDISADLRADREADGKITLNVPLVVQRDGRKSDLNVTGTVAPDATGFALDAHLTSALLVLDDVKILAAPFASSAETPSAAPEKNPPRDTAPPWAGIHGKVTLALKKLVYSDVFQVADVGGTLRLEAGALKLEGMRAGVGEAGELKLNGGVTFDEKARDPYTLKADLAVTDFDSGPLFRAINPNKTPTVEGRFNVTSQIAGTGPTIGLLAEQARGTFNVNSKGGVFRGLAAVLPADKLQAAQSTLAFVGGLLGGSTGKTVGISSEILKMLSEISFDQLTVTAERDAGLNMVLKDFSLIAPDVRLNGVGKITYTPNKSLLEQALDMQVSLGARGRLGELMGQVKVLRAEKDNLGYTAFSAPIKVGGTLDKPDTSDLSRKMIDLVLEKSGVGAALEKILGGGK